MTATDLFQRITDRMIADIETGAGEWKMPWRTIATAGTPTSIDGRPYRGINTLILALSGAAAPEGGYASGVWATYKSFQRHGIQVRRGQHGTKVALWKPTTRHDPADTHTDADNATTERDGEPRRRLVARVYTVFAAEQTDGATELIARRHADRAEQHANRIEAADCHAAATGATIIEHGNRAFYQPDTDVIHIPPRVQFDSAELHAGTRLHELIHWSAPRLGRDLSGRFGSDAYAAEELIAELGAAMVCAQLGIDAATRHDHAAYCASWLRILRADARALVTVASRAQAAVDYLNTLTGTASGTPQGEPSDG